MNINTAFPSKYLKAADLQGTEPVVTIAKVVMEEIGGGDEKDTKPIVYFQGKQKGLVLNVTNANNISVMHGPETEEWIGKQVTLFTAWVDFQGRSVEAIRVKPARPAHRQAPVQQQAAHARSVDELNDDIPF